MHLYRVSGIALRNRSFSRSQSSVATAAYPDRVQAYPFAFGLDKALRYAGRLVGSISHSPIRSEAAYYLRSHAVSPIQPEFAAAIYLPTWVIDAEVKADFWPKPDNETPARKRKVTGYLVNSFMPGFALEPFSRLNFKSDDLQEYLLLPFSKLMEEQHDQKITCIPFAFTPFSLPSLVRKLKDVDHAVKLGSLKAHVMAAYPILIPVYALQYKHRPQLQDDQNANKIFSIILEAYRPNGNLFLDNSHKMFKPEEQEFIIDGPQKSTGMQQPFDVQTPGAPQVPMGLADLITTLFGREGAMAAYFSHWKEENPSEEIDWKDLRIREYADEEVEINRDFLSWGQFESFYSSRSDLLASIHDPVRAAQVTRDTLALLGDSTVMKVRPKLVDIARRGSWFTRSWAYDTEIEPISVREIAERAKEMRSERKPEWLAKWQTQRRMKGKQLWF